MVAKSWTLTCPGQTPVPPPTHPLLMPAHSCYPPFLTAILLFRFWGLSCLRSTIQMAQTRMISEVLSHWDAEWWDFPDGEDGFGGIGGVSAILQRHHGDSHERTFFKAAVPLMAAAALAPALATIPLLLAFRGGMAVTPPPSANLESSNATIAVSASVDEAALIVDPTSWVGAGGRGSWGCCLPWQPAFYALVAVPSTLLSPIHVGISRSRQK
eukprot:COSAG05_NODE_1466_length_4804_cov_1.788523_1_plen_213_part_00